VQGGFFSRKKPLITVLSVYSNWRTAVKQFGLVQAIGPCQIVTTWIQEKHTQVITLEARDCA
jgi:hypothetical protein